MKAAVLFTGGKDSVAALHRAVWSGLEVSVLLSVIPLYKYSMLYHQPIFNCLIAQAQSLGIPLETIGLEDPTMEKKILEILARRARDKYGIKVLVTGAIKSQFQYRVFNEVANSLGLELYAPHWMMNEEEYLRNLLKWGIKFTLITVTSMGIPHTLLGKIIDVDDVNRLIVLSRRYGFNPSFEGGDAETLVLDAPLFKYRLVVTGRVQEVSEFEAYYTVERVSLVKKQH